MANHKNRNRNKWQDAKSRVYKTGVEMARELDRARGRSVHAEALLSRALVRIAKNERKSLSDVLFELQEELELAKTNAESPAGTGDSEVSETSGEEGIAVHSADEPTQA